MTIAIEGIKASLATLELAILSNNGDNSLSSDEVESAHVSLDKLILIAEDAKAKLPSTSAISTEQDDINTAAASSSRQSDTTSHSSASASTLAIEKQTSILKKKPPEEPSNDASSSNDENDYSGSAPPERRGSGQRRLSHPCLVPADAVAGQLEVSCYV